MKNIFKLSLITAVLFTYTFAKDSITIEKSTKIDVKKVCDVKSNGINKVLKTAKEYNSVAKEYGLEFMRLGMKTSQYIDAVEKALKSKNKKIDIVNKKKKKTGEVSVDFGAWRACTFSIRALQQHHEAKSSWKLAVPGDGYQY